MSNKQISGAFSQRQFKRNNPAKTTELFDVNPGQNYHTVRVGFDEQMGKVTGESLVNGEIKAKTGDIITLTATPNEGYVLVEWMGIPAALIYARNTGPNGSPSTTFQMPDRDLTVKARFEKLSLGGNPSYPLGPIVPSVSSEDDHKIPQQKGFNLKAALKKYWWVIAIIVAYCLYKEGEK